MPSWRKTRWWCTSRALPATLALALLTACATPAPDLFTRLDALLPADILLLGEQHDAPDHQRLQRAVVQALAARGQLAALTLEMADQGVSTVDLTQDAPEDKVRQALQWNDAGWPWATYGPVVMAAVRAGVPVLGANLPRTRMPEAMKNEAWDQHLSPEKLAIQRQRIREGHCGLLPDGQIAPMTRIQIARDAAMAQTVLAAWQPGKTVLLVAGAGHVARELGVPTHLPAHLPAHLPDRFTVRSTDRFPDNIKVKVVLALASTAQTAMDSGADGVWLTPALPPWDYCADMKKQMGR
ncbi:MAG: hypothetical protein RIS34_263 [Pseudomonadota bacterium]